MPERIIVSFRGVAAPQPEPDGEQGYLARALALKKRAEALGATLCAWSAQTFSFEFAPEDIEEAVLLAVLAAEDTSVRPDARFAAGIAQGEITYVGEAGRFSMLSWGKPLLVAVTLARVALPGDVLLDPALPAVLSGELMISGTHRGVDGARRVRGLRLDAQQPLRRQVAESVARLRAAPLIGRDAELAALVVPPGALAVIRAEAGAGGTRLLAELLGLLSPSRSLFVAPVGAAREPLGALRRAMARGGLKDARDPGGRPPSLSGRLQAALGQLLAGYGVDPKAAAELLFAWLAPAGDRPGLLAIDDAAEVDAATLDAIAAALRMGGGLRAVVRLGRSEPLPPPLASTPCAPELTLGPLPAPSAQELVRRLLDGCIDDAGARRWAARGGGSPLSVRETVCEGLESGALRWIGRAVGARRRSAGRGGAARAMTDAEIAAPPAWRPIAGRARLLAIGQRAVLTALAMLGGDAPDAAIDALCSGTGAPKVAAIEAALIGAGWVFRPEPGWLKLTSRTLREVLLAAVPLDDLAAWHLAAARAVEDHAGPLGLADAAWYAAQAGDGRAAADLAARAARVAGDARLEPAAAELIALAAQQAASVELAPHEAAGGGSSQPPAHRQPVEGEGEAGSSAPGAERLVALARRALVEGDLGTLERLVNELRRTGGHLDLVERMCGLISLGRGAKDDALRCFRSAAEADAPLPRRARALLAYGVALAAAGRAEHALLSTLGALARAREAHDRRGEQACARFLAQLSAATGHAEAARTWIEVAHRASGAAVD